MVAETKISSPIRPAAVAGSFYPADANELRAMVLDLLNKAKSPALDNVRSVIAPHAGYQYSGLVAAHSFRTLRGLPQGVYTVYLMGPAHYVPVYGVGLSSARAFETPLGRVPVAQDRVERLLALGGPYHLADPAHAPEHSLEVELPFLQTVLPQAQIVPMLFDSAADYTRVGEDLAAILAEDPRGLLVVSSDLSHYHTYDEAVRLDRAFLNAVITGDISQASGGEACGLPAILTAMTVAEILGWRAHLLAYRNSGDSGGPIWEVVGYGAVAYTG